MIYSFLSYRFELLSWVMLATVMIAFFVVCLAWGKRRQPAIHYLILLEAAVAVWAFACIFEAAAPTTPLKMFWSIMSYPGILCSPVFFFIFAVKYARARQIFSGSRIWLLFIVPVITFILAATNPLHGLIWSSIRIQPENNIAIYGHGLFFWIMLAYIYLLLCGGIFLIFRSAFHVAAFFKVQTMIVLAAALLPFAGSVLYLFGFNPIPGLDWTPPALALSGLLLCCGMLGLGVFRLIPIARNKVVETMFEGVLIFDTNEVVVDANPAVGRLLGTPPHDLIGQKAGDILGWWADIANRPHPGEACLKIALQENGRAAHIEVRFANILGSSDDILGRYLILRDVTDRTMAEEKLKRLAATDELTGLHNRRRFQELAEREVRRAGRFGRPLSLLMIDIDHFKRINDGFGHAVGDKVLVRLAEVMRRALRDTDIVGRIGGEEFAVMLPETKIEAGASTAWRLIDMTRSEVVESGAGPVRFTISAGAAGLRAGDGLQSLMEKADKALYQAKNNGRDRMERSKD